MALPLGQVAGSPRSQIIALMLPEPPTTLPAASACWRLSSCACGVLWRAQSVSLPMFCSHSATSRIFGWSMRWLPASISSTEAPVADRRSASRQPEEPAPTIT